MTMSTSEEIQLPSFDTIRCAHQPVGPSLDTQRFFWTVDGPLTNSIWIMKNANNPDSLEAYFQEQSWHPATRLPLTEPKISSITVHIDDLDCWEDKWLDFHRDHSDGPDGDEENKEVQWGALPDYDPDEDEEGPENLLVCCGTKRPRGKVASIVVKSIAGSFVTVHDYVSTVHPWLMSLRDDLLEAMGMWDDKPLPSETKLMVNYTGLDNLKMYEQASWIKLEKQNAISCRFLDAYFLQQGRAGQRR